MYRKRHRQTTSPYPAPRVVEKATSLHQSLFDTSNQKIQETSAQRCT
jgi:hypothetical protein